MANTGSDRHCTSANTNTTDTTAPPCSHHHCTGPINILVLKSLILVNRIPPLAFEVSRCFRRGCHSSSGTGGCCIGRDSCGVITTLGIEGPHKVGISSPTNQNRQRQQKSTTRRFWCSEHFAVRRMAKSKKKQEAKVKMNRGGYTPFEEDTGFGCGRRKGGGKGGLKRGKKNKGRGGGGDGGGTNGNVYDDGSFRRTLQADGTRYINEMAADGNCLFRSLSDQLFLDDGIRHERIREEVCDFLEANEKEFTAFLILDEEEEDEEDASSFEEYVEQMREDGQWAGNLELAIAARLYRRNITVFSAVGAFSIESGHEKVSGPDMLLSYHENDHYNSVRESESRRRQRELKEAEEEKKEANYFERNQNDDDHIGSTAKRKANGKKIPQQRRNDICACGSGLRYKRCCLVTEKNQIKLSKWKEKHGLLSDGLADKDETRNDEDEAYDGHFKILKI